MRIKHGELFKIIKGIPEGSIVYRTGTYALVFLTPDNEIIRIVEKTGNENRKKELNRLDHPSVLQPLNSKTTKNYLIEVLPRIKTLDDSFSLRKTKRYMEKQGLRICDWKKENFGVLPNGEIVAIDPGAVVLK